jgi:uncharacterized membrane protein YfcA
MDILGLILMAIALVLGVSAGEWVLYRTRKKIIGWPVGILVFFVSLAILRRLI